MVQIRETFWCSDSRRSYLILKFIGFLCLLPAGLCKGCVGETAYVRSFYKAPPPILDFLTLLKNYECWLSKTEFEKDLGTKRFLICLSYTSAGIFFGKAQFYPVFLLHWKRTFCYSFIIMLIFTNIVVAVLLLQWNFYKADTIRSKTYCPLYRMFP